MQSEEILLNELDFCIEKTEKKQDKNLKSLRFPWKLTQQEWSTVFSTCWKFHWIWMRSEEILLNELDFYLEEKGLEW